MIDLNWTREIGNVKFLKSLFPFLKGIDFKDVSINNNLNQYNFKDYICSLKNSRWQLGISDGPILYRTFKSNPNLIGLKSLLVQNEICISDVILDKQNELKSSWLGQKFIIDFFQLDDLDVAIIHPNQSTQKSIKIFNDLDSSFMSNKSQLNWILGINKIYDNSLIQQALKDGKTVDLQMTPVFSHNSLNSIEILVEPPELAYVVIEKLIEINGGKESFIKEGSELYNDWTFTGYTFVIGFIPEKNTVKINRILNKDNEKKGVSIHLHSEKIKNELVKLNHLIYQTSLPYYDGRFFTLDKEASKICAYFEEIDLPLKIFKDIVFSFNKEDSFLEITISSISQFFNIENNEIITFDVPGKFRMDLTMEFEKFKIIIFPPNGIYGNWIFQNQQINEDVDIDIKSGKNEDVEDVEDTDIPTVKFSQYVRELKLIDI